MTYRIDLPVTKLERLEREYRAYKRRAWYAAGNRPGTFELRHPIEEDIMLKIMWKIHLARRNGEL